MFYIKYWELYPKLTFINLLLTILHEIDSIFICCVLFFRQHLTWPKQALNMLFH